LNRLGWSRGIAFFAAAGVPGLGAGAPLTVSVSDAAGRPLAQAVVYVLLHGASMPAAPGATAQIGQRERQFQPQISVIQTGTSVSFPNFDTVRHHVYSFSPIRKFELKLYAGTPSEPVLFDKAGTAVLGCNIHDRMSAFVHVVDTPLFGKTDAQGKTTFDVPAGEHQLRAWHFQLPAQALPLERPLRMSADAAQVAVTLAVKAAGQ
jgi:plastocyanin